MDFIQYDAPKDLYYGEVLKNYKPNKGMYIVHLNDNYVVPIKFPFTIQNTNSLNKI
ncbi:MAG: hypothetical protein K0R15_340 [Clostridiales bacterium]|jgi:hypothetical protein|nr:hypothetical protein [Clostridiales bacterium]